jgi:hypothetical protein
VDLPVLEITPAVAEAIVGQDVLPLVEKVDKSAKAPKPVETGRRVSMASASEERKVPIDNVVGILKGSDPELADEYVVIGAHYDHVGVDTRGRIGFGADDNASGTAAMLEVATALAEGKPRRSILVCAFAAEEDGLLGSAALVDDPPVPTDAMVTMINMDMVGRGETDEVVVLGLIKNPGFEKLLKRAQKLQPTKVKNIVQRQGQELFQRSDHYNFHKKQVPVLFFFEQLPIDKNEDYHTWRDSIDKLDFEKIARTSRLVFNTCWLLANLSETCQGCGRGVPRRRAARTTTVRRPTSCPPSAAPAPRAAGSSRRRARRACGRGSCRPRAPRRASWPRSRGAARRPPG